MFCAYIGRLALFVFLRQHGKRHGNGDSLGVCFLCIVILFHAA